MLSDGSGLPAASRACVTASSFSPSVSGVDKSLSANDRRALISFIVRIPSKVDVNPEDGKIEHDLLIQVLYFKSLNWKGKWNINTVQELYPSERDRPARPITMQSEAVLFLLRSANIFGVKHCSAVASFP
jgi:hypothetical protein